MTRYEVDAETILGENYKITILTTSNSNPKIDTTITVTATVTDVYDDPMVGETVEVTCTDGVFTEANGTSITPSDNVSATTNASGQVELTYECSTFGIVTFQSGSTDTQILVDGWKTLYGGGTNDKWALYRSKDRGIFVLKGWSTASQITTTFTNFGSENYASNIPPKQEVMGSLSSNLEVDITNQGQIKIRARSGTISANTQLWGQFDYEIGE